MSKKISAEFLNVDMAENAARQIRESFKSIKNITIKTKRHSDHATETFLPVSSTPGGYGYTNDTNGSGFAYMAAFTAVPEIRLDNHTENELDLREQTWMEVCCEEEDLQAITSTIRYYGGNKIKDIV